MIESHDSAFDERPDDIMGADAVLNDALPRRRASLRARRIAADLMEHRVPDDGPDEAPDDPEDYSAFPP